MIELVWSLFGLLVAVTFVALGAYVGALRALDVYFSDESSIFLSEDRERGFD